MVQLILVVAVPLLIMVVHVKILLLQRLWRITLGQTTHPQQNKILFLYIGQLMAVMPVAAMWISHSLYTKPHPRKIKVSQVVQTPPVAIPLMPPPAINFRKKPIMLVALQPC